MAGTLTLDVQQFSVETHPDQQLIAYTTEPDSPPHEALHFLLLWSAAHTENEDHRTTDSNGLGEDTHESRPRRRTSNCVGKHSTPCRTRPPAAPRGAPPGVFPGYAAGTHRSAATVCPPTLAGHRPRALAIDQPASVFSNTPGSSATSRPPMDP